MSKDGGPVLLFLVLMVFALYCHYTIVEVFLGTGLATHEGSLPLALNSGGVRV